MLALVIAGSSLVMLAVGGCTPTPPRARAVSVLPKKTQESAPAEEAKSATESTGEAAMPAETEPAAADAAPAAAAAPAAPAPPAEAPAAPTAPKEPAPQEAVAAADPKVGAQLFARHCAACHGDRGDALGIAAKFVFPKPRDLRAGRFRLVSTANNVPTRDDLHSVLLRGMPGSSMPPWKHLPQAEREALVDEIMRIRAEGAREAYIKILKEEEELTDDEIAAEDVQKDIQDYVTRFTTPGDTTAVPEMGEPNAEMLAAAKETYAKSGCLQCHGATGKGDGVQKMVDEEKYPTAPRDFTAGIFKGGHDAASIYRRIAYGMPGTPMPSSSQMTPEQMVGLVHYIRSMSTEEQREAAVLKREAISAKKLEAVSPEPGDASWGNVPAVAVRTMPLWWRDSVPDLQVQAAHDGKSLAVRLSWQDASQNERAVRPEEFEDMAALELSVAGSEPFLGMGAAGTVVEIWQWRGGMAADGAEDQLFDEYPFATEEYKRLLEGKEIPDFVTARVAGNPLATRNITGSNLVAKGLGSTTFRPAVSQVVATKAAWADGRWTVVFVRPLAIESGEGLSLVAGEPFSAAFAVWDGAARDRAAQKLISIWNDLKLE